MEYRQISDDYSVAGQITAGRDRGDKGRGLQERHLQPA